MSHHQKTNENSRLLGNILRFGVIYEAKPPVYRVRDGKFISGWLPHLQLKTKGDVHWWPLELDENVAFLSTGDGKGLILGAVWVESPDLPATEHRIEYQTGDFMVYDKASKTMTHQGDSLVLKGKTIEHKRK